MADNAVGAGLVARVVAATRYALTGNAPGDWFGPATPLPQQAPEEVRGRAWDFPVALNLNFTPRGTEPLTFVKLKRMATHPLVAALIQRQKDLVCGLDWEIKPRKKVGVKLLKDDAAKTDPGVVEITEFFAYPDKEHDWVQWLSALLDQLLVIDATTLYSAPSVGGKPYAFQLLDGANIKPIIDQNGRRPQLPFPAYQEILKGLPAVNYTADELIYFPQVYRVDRLYGYSRVEQAWELIDAAISRLRNQKAYFDYGNIGDGYFTAPETWQNPDEVRKLEARWNAIMQGDPAKRRSAPFLPFGIEWHPTKTDVLADDFDEYLIRLLCFPFGVAPGVFMKQAGLAQGSNASDHDAAEAGGVAPLMSFVERLLSHAIAKWFKRPDLEFAFTSDREFDPKTASEIDDARLKNGTTTINAVKDRNGEKPIPGGDIPLIYNGTGWALLDDVLHPPEPQEVAPVAAAVAGTPGGDLAAGDVKPDDKTKAPVKGAKAMQPAALKKAVDAATRKRLHIIIRRYLEKKGEAFTALVQAEMVKADDLPSSGNSLSWETIGALLADDDFWDWGDLSDEVQPLLAGVAATAGESALSQLGLFDAAVLAAVSADAVAYAEARGAELVGMRWVNGKLVVNPNPKWAITDSTRDMIRGLLVDAMKEGQSTAQFAEAMKTAYPFSDARAETIARTETGMADIRGTAMAWKESGVVVAAKFLASPDCCDECQEQDGDVVELEATDDIELPHPNCRCNWVAVLEDADAEKAEAAED
jgi:hypothetical protein